MCFYYAKNALSPDVQVNPETAASFPHGQSEACGQTPVGYGIIRCNLVREISTHMKKIFLFLLVVLLSCPPLIQAKSQTATAAVDVSAGQYKAVRLKSLPQDSVVKVDIRSDGIVTVLFATEEQYKEYPDIPRPLFQSTVRDRFNFTVTIPATGNYHLVFDNSAGSRAVKIDATITGATDADKELLQGSRHTEQGENIGRDLGAIGSELGKVFIFKPFPIIAKKCGKPGAFSGSDGVVLCLEFVKAISDTMGNKEKTATVLLFAAYHEAGHILLSQWGYPFYDNEEIADEFAAMLFVMLGQQERLRTLMEYFLSNPASNELLARALKGDRHPLSLERARNIVRMGKDTGRLKRWQVIFVPHLQTAVLERHKKNPPSWADPALVEKELALRTRFVF